MKFINKFDYYFTQFSKIVAVIFLVSILLDVGISVVCRYVFFYSTPWADPIAKYMVIWLTFISASLGIREGTHITFDSIAKKFPQHQKIFFVFVNTTMLTFCTTMVFFGLKYATEHGYSQNDPVLFDLNMIFPYLSVPVGFVFMIIQIIVVSLRFLYIGEELSGNSW
jgi:TRAP-type C4-dicarboxylate transport system permease small subunit